MIYLEKNEKMTKRVKNYIQDITGIDYNELMDIGTKLRSLCRNDNYPFQAYKIVQTEGNSYGDAWKEVYSRYYGLTIVPPKAPTYISEYYIKRQRLIDDLFEKVKPKEKKYDEIVFAEYLSEIICYKLISLETLWCMEFEQDDEFVLSENNTTIFKYCRFFVQLFLQYTNDICREYLGFGYNNENEIIDYKKEIDDFLVNFFNKKAKEKTHK